MAIDAKADPVGPPASTNLLGVLGIKHDVWDGQISAQRGGPIAEDPTASPEFAVTSSDIEERLWQARSCLDAVSDSLSGHAMCTLDASGDVTTWNTAASKIQGYAAAEIIGKPFACFYTADDRADGAPGQALGRVLDGEKVEEEGWRVRQDGERFWANVVLHPLRSRNGRITGCLHVARDSTQNLQIEKLLEEVNQSRRQEMVAQLTGGVAHDFNNLLTAIDASYELIKRYSRDERIQRILRTNKGAIERSRTLIGQLLLFSRKQDVQPRATYLHELITVFDVLLQKAVGESTRLDLDLMHTAPAVQIDQAQFQSALLNLAMNAREAMPNGGILEIFMEMLKVSGDHGAASPDLAPGEYVVLGVKDTGSGMSAETRARAVDPFFTTKLSGKGPGLGLTQCYDFARQAGGTLTIGSEPGRGTTVKMFLPALPTTARQPSRDRGTRAILVVDDDVHVRVLVSEMLRDLGHTVLEAEDARDALNQLHSDPSIDFLFSDIVMPDGMNGLELVRAARVVRPDLPALLASGYPRDALRDLAKLPEDVSFLPKPYTIADLSFHINNGPAAGSRGGLRAV